MKKFVKITIASLALTALAACSELDVVARDAVVSFKALTAALPPAAHEPGKGLVLSAPDGEQIIFAGNWAEKTSDISLSLPARPLIDAGLIPGKLPARFSFDSANGRLNAAFDLGTVNPADGGAAAGEIFAGIVKNYRDRIGYHEQFDHYGLALGDGNMLEWAKDPQKNDKDLVLVLDPAPFLAAGLQTGALSGGWVFGQVTVKDQDGRSVQVDKLLKPYNLP